MSVAAVGNFWTVSGLGPDILIDVQADANTIDAALTAVAGTESYATTVAQYKGLVRGGHWGHISTLSVPPEPAADIEDIDGGKAA
jgi:hypothetical protein